MRLSSWPERGSNRFRDKAKPIRCSLAGRLPGGSQEPAVFEDADLHVACGYSSTVGSHGDGGALR